MSSKDQNLSSGSKEKLKSVEEFSFAIIVSDWNEEITYSLRDACIETLQSNGAKEENIHVHYVPGAFELPLGARIVMGQEKIDAAICLGCVIKGETEHDVYINNAVAQGIMNLGLTSKKPVIFGVLTPNDKQQAIDRSGGKYGNKGVEAAQTAIKMVHLSCPNRDSQKSIGSCGMWNMKHESIRTARKETWVMPGEMPNNAYQGHCLFEPNHFRLVVHQTFLTLSK